MNLIMCISFGNKFSHDAGRCDADLSPHASSSFLVFLASSFDLRSDFLLHNIACLKYYNQLGLSHWLQYCDAEIKMKIEEEQLQRLKTPNLFPFTLRSFIPSYVILFIFTHLAH